MTAVSTTSHVLAARELLLSVVQNRPELTAEQVANLQEAIEHIDRTHQLLGSDD